MLVSAGNSLCRWNERYYYSHIGGLYSCFATVACCSVRPFGNLRLIERRGALAGSWADVCQILMYSNAVS